MSYLTAKKILLGVTGSIAAYKAAELIRLLRTNGAEVKVVITKDAREFITELTLQALSGQPVHKELLDPESEASMSHITLAKWADLLLIAPATANVMAKLAHGIADDLLSTLYLACPVPVAFAPAMNQQMWSHSATVLNKNILSERGHLFWGPATGEQACGDIGPGRLLDPEGLLHHIVQFFAPKCLSGITVMITAGPTQEAIDPVRYMSNRSSGKMGYSLAQVARELGANVLLISGPSHLTPPFKVNMLKVETALEMHDAVMKNIHHCQIFIGAAAVADYRCVNIAKQKIKKTVMPTLNFEKNPDILLEISQLKQPPFLVGFAAETEDLINQAKDKLQKKKLDMIIANNVGSPHGGFNSDVNQLTVLTKNSQYDFPLETKYQLACKLMPMIFAAYQEKIKQGS